MPTTKKIKALVNQGLHLDNLYQLIEECKNLSSKSPVLYFVLNSIFVSLSEEYDGQEITNDIYDKDYSILQPVLIECIDKPNMSSIENLIKEFWKLDQ